MPDEEHSAWSGHSRIFFLSLKRRLNALSLTRTWQILVLAMIAIAAGDFLLRPTAVYLGPLYLLPICLACWRLNVTVGMAVALVSAVALSITNLTLLHHMPLGAVFGNLMLQMFTLTAIAWIVSGFRYSIERERFLGGRDGLTGALNKSAFEQNAERMILDAAAKDRSLLLAFLDLDGFKIINDRYGHEAGDEVLKRFAAEGRASLRKEDCFGRLGGDEFAVLMPLPSVDAASETAEQLHQRFTQALAATPHDVTCSMGALIVPPSGKVSFRELIREADRLMYAVKYSGKDGVRFATHAPSLDPEAILLPPRLPDRTTPDVLENLRGAV